VRQRSLRWEERVCVLEGPDLIEAALESAQDVEALYVDRAAIDDATVVSLCERARDAGIRLFALDEGLLGKIADAQHPQPVMASVSFRVADLADLSTRGLVLVLDNLRDPGNAGTIIRSADAAGASGVVFSGDCVDPFNPKALRASAGSVFHVPLAFAALEETLSHFSRRGVRTYATAMVGLEYRRADLSGGCVVVIGNESTGMDEASRAHCDDTISIDMVGRSESLNAGVAASLIAFEALHQRRDTTDG
jgi:TrmH family RNA methyltransferase